MFARNNLETGTKDYVLDQQGLERPAIRHGPNRVSDEAVIRAECGSLWQIL